MRVLIVDEEIIGGGVETLRRQLVPELAKVVDEVTWVLPGFLAEKFRDCANVKIETLEPRTGIGRIKRAVARRLYDDIPRRIIDERLRDLARGHQSHILLTTCVLGQEFPALDLPVAGFVSDVNPGLPPPILDNIETWIEKSAATFAVSDFTCSELRRMKTDSADKIHSVPLAGPGWMSGENAPPGRFLYPAAPNKHKGHLILLQAALGLARRGLDFRLTFSGPGMNETSGEVVQAMRAFFDEHKQLLGGRVTIKGDVGPEEVPRLFSESSCVVLPSAYEGFGLPLAEALAHGKRVVASEIPPFREQVNRYGCERMVTFVPARDAAAVESAMAAHLNGADSNGMTDDELKEALGRWTWADAARRCRDLLEEVARG